MLTTHVQKCLYLLALIREEKKFCNALASLRLLTIGVTFMVYILFLDKSYETPFFEAYCTQIPLSDSAELIPPHPQGIQVLFLLAFVGIFFIIIGEWPSISHRLFWFLMNSVK